MASGTCTFLRGFQKLHFWGVQLKLGINNEWQLQIRSVLSIVINVSPKVRFQVSVVKFWEYHEKCRHLVFCLKFQCQNRQSKQNIVNSIKTPHCYLFHQNKYSHIIIFSRTGHEFNYAVGDFLWSWLVVPHTMSWLHGGVK